MTTYEINNPNIEAFITKEAEKNNMNTNEYLANIVLYQMELKSIKSDLNQMEKEIEQVNNGSTKLKSAYSLLDEL